MKKNYFNNLNLFRGLAAFLVFIGHLRNVYFKDYEHIGDNSYLIDFFYFITSLGHAAVMIFFVISGFVITNLIFKDLNSFSLIKYLIDRLIRLWTVLIPAIIFSLIVYYYLANVFPEIIQGEYRNIINSGPSIENYKITLFQVIGNIFFLQGILVETLEINSPLWSLSYELWYYVLFPVILYNFRILKCESNKKNLIYFFLFLILMLLFIPSKILLYFLIWLLGSLLYFLKDIQIKYTKINIILSLFFFILTLFNFKINFFKLSNFSNDLIVSLGFGYFLFVTLKLKNTFFELKIFNYLSKISYSLYLFHFPITLIIFTLIQKDKLIFNSINLIYFFLICFLIIIITNLFWFIFERNTYLYRNVIKKFSFKIIALGEKYIKKKN